MPEPYVVVVGAANVDIAARSAGAVVPATSNPGTTSTTPGGVGRNIAENLARLGTPTHLISVVGEDRLGDDLLAATRDGGVDVGAVRRSRAGTGTYTAILDERGELVVAVADMAAADEITPEHLESTAELIGGARLLVLEANLRSDTLTRALSLAAAAQVDVVLDPVSVPKARRVRLGRHPVHTLTPNADELGALTGLPVTTEDQWVTALRELHGRDVGVVWVRRGARGSLLSTAGAPGVPLSLDAEPVAVVDVTGAGDAMTAAYCHVLVRGGTPPDAARFGHRAAAATIASHQSVRPDLSDLLRSTP